MVFETTTTLTADAVFDRAEAYFAERVPTEAVFPEKRSAGHLVFRGQGGEELVLMARPTDAGGTMVRGSTLLFDQVLGRFLTTLPPVTQP
jgi:hypothetical protein